MRSPKGESSSPDPVSLAQLITKKTGTRVRWDPDTGQFVTADGDIYPPGTIEDAARGMEGWADFTGEGPTYGE